MEKFNAVFFEQVELEHRNLSILKSISALLAYIDSDCNKRNNFHDFHSICQERSYWLTPWWVHEAGRNETIWVWVEKFVKTDSSIWYFWSTAQKQSRESWTEYSDKIKTFQIRTLKDYNKSVAVEKQKSEELDEFISKTFLSLLDLLDYKASKGADLFLIEYFS